MVLLATLIGCATGGKPRDPTGLSKRVPVMIEPWKYGSTVGSILTTAHYRIFTTVSPDDSLFDALPQLMEGAYTQYRVVAPGAPPTDRPMVCYIFGQRSEWVDYTRRRTGPMAKIYLQIAYGAYALGDEFVAYDIGDYRTLSTAAHEGWHQFASRHFRGRLPAFLEEGTATLFEDMDKLQSLPQWNLQANASRQHALWLSIEQRYAFPLSELVTYNAGDIIHRPGDRIDAFYSQNWAFVRYLRDGYDRKYRPAYERLLTDVANGNVWGTSPTTGGWDRSRVRSILEHYLGVPFDQIDQEFLAFCKQIARED